MLSRNALSTCRTHTKVLCSHRSLATVSDIAGPSSSSPKRPPNSSQNPSKPTINAAVILNRSPIITRTPSLFERSYYSYHARIQRALFNPFPSEFYFKAGSLLEGKFVEEEQERERLTFGGPTFVRRKGTTTDADAGAAGSAEVIGEAKTEEPMPRVHEADIKGDVRSLDRQGERNIYLLLQGRDPAGNSAWRFPQGGIQEGELLHEAAERDLHAECGKLMDTWVVSRNPIGVYEPSRPTGADELSLAKSYIFFYKAHILAGQVQPDAKNILDFAWLTKEEIEPRVDKEYWSGVKDMLSDF
ncbi:hypothetical protein AcW1_005548 [Taiwanofungus camphoratus]|nr:hypothetical protein AcW2_004317 [Antrodia cinnamomea]KAI0957020.1 hypothetical protein AcW1_005548 [Antrodia cinnamomea]